MNSAPFTLNSDAELLATFHPKDQRSVVFHEDIAYPFTVENYYAWTESSRVYTYLIFKAEGWKHQMGIVFQRNGSGNAISPAGMCDWCHSFGASNEIGLLTTTLDRKTSGGSWLCLDLSCLEKIAENALMSRRNADKQIERLCNKMGEFIERVRNGRDS